MDNQEKYTDDFLRKYIIPERSEKAPEGFTSKIMTRVQLETKAVEKAHSKNFVPLISVIVTLLLIAAAFLIPGSQNGKLFDTATSLINNINIQLPSIDLSSVFSLTLPSITLYVVIGIFVLTLFDKALQGIFRKEK
jgi:hypothetical protein